MYSTVYRTLRPLWPGGKLYQQRQKELEQSQWLSPEDLRSIQLGKLRSLVKYAYEHVLYYHDLYQRLDIHPEDIRSIKDFQALPFLTRQEINDNLDRLVSPELRSLALPNSTGGSTGQPMRFYAEKAFDWWDPALELRGRGWYGVHEGDKMAWVWGAQRDMYNQNWRARLKAALLQERYLNAFSMSEEKMRSFAQDLVRWKPAMFRAYASALTLFAQYIKDNHITGIQPKLIETTAEKVTDLQRELLEEVFHCKVADWYTARELGTIGFQCPEGWLHICETRFLEVITNGQEAQPGELGEVVVTSLHQYAMPFIRYKIGDMAVYEPGCCPCGRGLPRLREVVGRLQDFLVTPEGNFVHGGYFPHTFRQWPEIVRYQVYQPDKTHLNVRMVCKRDCGSGWLNSVQSEIQNRFGADMNISIEMVDEIELSSAGKHRFIISDVKPDFVS